MWRGRSCFARKHAGQAIWNLRHCDWQCVRSIERSIESKWRVAGPVSPQVAAAAARRFRTRIQNRPQTFFRFADGFLCATAGWLGERGIAKGSAAETELAWCETSGRARASRRIYRGPSTRWSCPAQSHEAAAKGSSEAFITAGGSSRGCGDQSQEVVACHGLRGRAERSAARFRSNREEQ
jgi:hypothetical protein